jgi:hypothetical protein
MTGLEPWAKADLITNLEIRLSGNIPLVISYPFSTRLMRLFQNFSQSFSVTEHPTAGL